MVARKYCHNTKETSMRIMSQTRKNVRSTKFQEIKTLPAKESDNILKSVFWTKKSKEVYIFTQHLSKIYAD